MKNILILTYYFTPCRGVASYRPQSWAKDFHQHGFNPTFITRHWNGNESNWEDYLKDCGSEVKITTDESLRAIRLPYKKNKHIQFAEKKWVKRLFIDKLVYFTLAITGNFQLDVDAYNCFKEYLFKHLEKEQYKLIIVTSPPLNVVKLAYEANKKFKTPFVIDFQDSWNNFMLSKNYSPGVKEKFYNALKEFYLKRWLKKSLFITAVTPAFNSFLKKVTQSPIETITNGFEKEAYSLPILPSSLHLNISLMGTVHPIQDITMMIEGLNLFLISKNPKEVRLNFIGLDAIPEMAQKIKAVLPSEFITVSNRVSMKEAVKVTLSADILLFPSYKGYKGYYTAKIFEYLGAKRNILMVPGDKDIVDDLILKAQAGKIANSAQEFTTILEDWYNEWKETGAIKYNGIKENIDFFSRENQNKLLCEVIKKHLV